MIAVGRAKLEVRMCARPKPVSKSWNLPGACRQVQSARRASASRAPDSRRTTGLQRYRMGSPGRHRRDPGSHRRSYRRADKGVGGHGARVDDLGLGLGPGPDGVRAGLGGRRSSSGTLRRARDSYRGPDVMPSNTWSQAFGPTDRFGVRGAISPAWSNASRIADSHRQAGALGDPPVVV